MASYSSPSETESSIKRAGRPPRRSASDYRELIVEAAGAVMGEVGPGNAKMSDIARRAGISYGTLYRHFQDRGELFLAVLTRQTAMVEADWHKASEERDPLKRIVALALAPIRRHAGNPRIREVLSGIQGIEHLVGGAETEILRMERIANELMDKAMREALALGYFSGLDAETTAQAIMGIPHAHSTNRSTPVPKDWKHVELEVEKVVLRLAGRRLATVKPKS